MPSFWPQDQIETLFTNALAGGEAAVELPTPEDARRFSFACFNFRRGRAEFQNIMVLNPQDSVRVTLRSKAKPPQLKPVEPSEAAQ